MKKKVLASVICALILFSTLNSGCITEDDDNKESEPSEPIILKDAPTTLSETNTNQEIAIVLMSSCEPLRWSDLKFQISKDGNTYYVIQFNITKPHQLNIKCEKVGNNVNESRWENGETIWFYEDGANFEPGTFFYCKISHTPSNPGRIMDSRVMVY